MLNSPSTPSSQSFPTTFNSLAARILAACCFIGALTPASAADILFVQQLFQRDTVKMINLLTAQGHQVTVLDTAAGDTVPTGQQALGAYDLLICDEVISSGSVGDMWRNSPVPVVNLEGFLYSGTRSSFVTDDGVTGGTDPAGDAGYGQVTDETQIDILLPDHPLAAGLPSGLVDVWDPTVDPVDGEGVGVITFAGGSTFIQDAIRVAAVPGFNDRFSVFGVEAGSTGVNGETIPARWVHLPWNDSVEGRVMIEPSFFLFEAGVAWALGLAEPTQIHDMTPAEGGFLSADSLAVTFSVDKASNGGSPVEQSGIRLMENGADVSSALEIEDGGDQWNVVYDALESNQVYTFIASATAADGGLSARMVQFDTFDPNSYSVEAEDFNFEGGSFFDDITLCNTIGGADNCYFDRVGAQGIDKNEINMVQEITVPLEDEVYRFGAAFNREEQVDTIEASDPLTRQKYVDAGIKDYQVQNIVADEWLNYTRTFPAGRYQIYGRLSSSGPMTAQLGRVVSGADTENQTLEKLGRFVSEGTGGLYSLIPLTDDSGENPIVVEFDGGVDTLRVTALSDGFISNFYMFVPTDAEVNTPPTVAITQPLDGAIFNEGDTLTISAEATDNGAITRVEFYAGTEEPLELLGTASEAPYQIDFTPPILGALSQYIVRVVAIDDGGLSGQDEAAVLVNDPSILVVKTSDGAGADAEIGERPNEDRGDGDNDSMNVRIAITMGDMNRHDTIVMRFDLGALSLQDISSASLNMISFRALTGRDIHVYGVNDGAMGGDNNGTAAGYDDDTWEENAVTFSTMPGVTYDGDSTTRGLVESDLTDLGVVNLGAAQGDVWTFSSPELLTFLQTHPDNLATLLLEQDDDSTGQSRFATKEATALDGGSPSGQAGDFAPYLALRVGAPIVRITQPEDGSRFDTGSAIAIAADATDSGSIASVEFFAGSEDSLSFLGVDNEAPYEASFTPPGAGTYVIRAVATDNDGLFNTDTVTVNVTTPNLLPPPGVLAEIVWVSFHEADDVPAGGAAGVGFSMAPDVGYTDLLKANGYQVTRYVTTGDPDVGLLNEADLVIIGRSVNSGNYAGASASSWNSVTSPMIVMSGYTLRSSRMGYTTGTAMEDTTGDIHLTISDPSHPVFNGISLTGDTMDNPFAGIATYPTDGTTLSRGISINTNAVNAAGTVLAAISEMGGGPENSMVVGEWPAGAMLTHDGGAGTDALAGHRLVFLSGGREADTIDSSTAGLYDLTEDGARMFLNAVAYMLHPEPVEVTWVSFHEGDDAPAGEAAAAGFSEAPDVGYTDLLQASGFNVTRYVTTGDPDIELLNEAEVVIIGRSVNSANYSGASASSWNSVTSPMIVMSGYTLRSSRMGYTSGIAMADTTGDIQLSVHDPSHAVFSGVSLSGNVMDDPFAGIAIYPTDGVTAARGISVNTDPINSDGQALATIDGGSAESEGGMIIGEWQPGSLLTHDGGDGTDALAGHRLVFLSGSREADGIHSTTAGLFDLTDAGSRLFLNAVRYSASRKGGVVPPPSDRPVIESITLNADGTITLSWTGGGALETSAALPGNWTPIDGAVSPHTLPADASGAFFRIAQ